MDNALLRNYTGADTEDTAIICKRYGQSFNGTSDTELLCATLFAAESFEHLPNIVICRAVISLSCGVAYKAFAGA